MKALGEDGRIVVVSIDELLHQLLPPEMSARVVIPSRCTTDAHLPDVRAQCKVVHFKIKHFAMLAAIEASLASSQPFSITFSDKIPGPNFTTSATSKQFSFSSSQCG